MYCASLNCNIHVVNTFDFAQIFDVKVNNDMDLYAIVLLNNFLVASMYGIKLTVMQENRSQ